MLCPQPSCPRIYFGWAKNTYLSKIVPLLVPFQSTSLFCATASPRSIGSAYRLALPPIDNGAGAGKRWWKWCDLLPALPSTWLTLFMPCHCQHIDCVNNVQAPKRVRTYTLTYTHTGRQSSHLETSHRALFVVWLKLPTMRNKIKGRFSRIAQPKGERCMGKAWIGNNQTVLCWFTLCELLTKRSFSTFRSVGGIQQNTRVKAIVLYTHMQANFSSLLISMCYRTASSAIYATHCTLLPVTGASLACPVHVAVYSLEVCSWTALVQVPVYPSIIPMTIDGVVLVVTMERFRQSHDHALSAASSAGCPVVPF